MSAYMTLRTPMTDQSCLLEALEDEGIDRSQLQISSEPIALTGWRQGQRAHIVLGKELTGDRYNDVGFLATPTGYTAILSDDHPRYGRAWLARVHDRYRVRWELKEAKLAEAERRRLEEARRQLVESQTQAIYVKAKKLGYQIKESREGEVVRLVLVKRSY